MSDAQDNSPQDILPQDNLPHGNSSQDILLQDISPQDNCPRTFHPLLLRRKKKKCWLPVTIPVRIRLNYPFMPPIEFESDSVPCHALMEPKVPEKEVPPSHMETPTDQEKTRRRFEEQGARPKSYRRQQEERWQLLSGEHMKFRILIQDVPTRESRRSDRRPSSSHHRPFYSHQQSSTSRERPSTKSASTSHQRSSTPRRQSSRSYSSPSRQSRGRYSDLNDRHSGKDPHRISDRPPSSFKSSTATSCYRSDQSDSKRGCSSVREEGKRILHLVTCLTGQKFITTSPVSYPYACLTGRVNGQSLCLVLVINPNKDSSKTLPGGGSMPVVTITSCWRIFAYLGTFILHGRFHNINVPR